MTLMSLERTTEKYEVSSPFKMQTFLQIAFERVALLNKCLSKIIQGIPTSFRHSNFDFFFRAKKFVKWKGNLYRLAFTIFLSFVTF